MYACPAVRRAPLRRSRSSLVSPPLQAVEITGRPVDCQRLANICVTTSPIAMGHSMCSLDGLHLLHLRPHSVTWGWRRQGALPVGGPRRVKRRAQSSSRGAAPGATHGGCTAWLRVRSARTVAHTREARGVPGWIACKTQRRLGRAGLPPCPGRRTPSAGLDSGWVLGLINAQLRTVRQPDGGEQPPALVGHRLGELYTFGLELLDRRLDVSTHQIQLMPGCAVIWVDGQLRRWQGKDQPTMSDINRI